MANTFNRVLTIGYGGLASLRNLGIALGLMAGAAWADPVRLVALGDSLTQGYGLPVNEGFLPRLQSWLDAQGADVEIVNAGVSGDTTAGGLARVAWTLQDDVDAMIVALGGNDFLRGLDPAEARANLDGILAAAGAQDISVMLVGLTVSANYGAEYKMQFEGMYPELAEIHDALLFPTFFEGLLAENDTATARASYMQGDGLHPNAAGVDLIVEAMGPSVLELIERVK